jgi:hypothetical protein
MFMMFASFFISRSAVTNIFRRVSRHKDDG